MVRNHKKSVSTDLIKWKFQNGTFFFDHPLTFLSPDSCSNIIISDQNFTFTGVLGWVAGLMRNKANLIIAQISAGCC